MNKVDSNGDIVPSTTPMDILKGIQTCKWIEDDCDAGAYKTGCKQMFIMLEPPLASNGFNYCVYCGKKIEESK